MKAIQIFECVVNVTIGNGAGQFPFASHKTYTLKDLQKACLSAYQIRAYFKPRQVMTR